MYHGEDYDVAGFCVGVVEKSEIIDGSKVQDGDVLIALGSSGPHSNGYSLVRHVLLEQAGVLVRRHGVTVRVADVRVPDHDRAALPREEHRTDRGHEDSQRQRELAAQLVQSLRARIDLERDRRTRRWRRRR